MSWKNNLMKFQFHLLFPGLFFCRPLRYSVFRDFLQGGGLLENNKTRSVLLLLKQYGFTDKTLKIIHQNEDHILNVIYDKNHPFYNKYLDFYTSKEKELSQDLESLVDFSEKFTEKMKEYKIKGIKTYYLYGEDYPHYLFSKGNEPLFLFCYGNLELLNQSLKKVAIVGTRKASKIGLIKTKEYVKDYVQKNWVTVSGLAKGIDTIVHEETIKNKGKTIAVIPTSFEKIYPAENKDLFEDILKNNGLAISVIGPFENTYKSNFLERNSIIAKMSNEVFVIEASIKSGTLNTVRKGYEFNKKVYYDSSLLNKDVIDYLKSFNPIDVSDGRND
jgi:DNA processing protein